MRKVKMMMMALMMSFVFVSCGDGGVNLENDISVSNKGTVFVENGQNKKDTVVYTCLGCNENLKNISELEIIINESSNIIKGNLNVPPSFLPKKMDISIVREDSLYNFSDNKKIKNTFTVVVKYNYTAQNIYGTELAGEQIISFYLQNGKIVDLDSKIRLDKLEYNDGNINRNLYLTSKYGEMLIIPCEDGDLIVKTDGCVDEGSWLIFTLKNKKEIKLVSWNDFNCKGSSYFKINSNQVSQLKSSSVDLISFLDDKTITCRVPENQSGYFIEWINLNGK